MTHRINGLNEIAENYEAVFCDVWGVMHNGRQAYAAASEALARYRQQGGHVVFITNSPRPHRGVETQLAELGVDGEAYDAIATSGDVTRALIARAEGPLYHIGPDRDHQLFEGLGVDFAPLDEARSIACTGLVDDETEEPEDYRSLLESAAGRRLPLICANPDIVVERGERLIWCAGALARLYEELGGETLLAGKPHAPIYDLACELLAGIADREIDRGRILAVGDGMPTDVKGAGENGFDLLYIAAGIHAGEYGGTTQIDSAALDRFLDEQGAKPVAWMPHLTWRDA